MIIGGYQIINLKDTPIKVSTATKSVIDGIYEAIEGTRKAILLSGIVVETTSGSTTTDTEYHDCFIAPVLSNGDYTFTLYGYSVTITDDDEIYYTATTTK